MKNIFKQFAVWATPTKQSEFKKAIILLTIYYTVGVFVILTIFNIMVYVLFANSIREESIESKEHSALEEDEERETNDWLGEEKIREIEDDLARNLLTSDLAILLITLIVSYFISKRTLSPLEESYKKQKIFVGDVAHELRTPLAVMQAGGEVMLLSDRTIPEYTKFIEETLEEVKRLTTLSNDLLFLVSNNAKTDSLVSRISLGDVCQRQVDLMNAYANVKNVSLEVSIDKSVIVMGKSDDLIRLVVNLLKNAVDYNKNGGSVSVCLQKKHGHAVLKISDTGIGIKKDDLSYIFERFYKADNSRKLNASGTGLGLAIVKEIVNDHQGSIKVDSVIGEGTTFEIILPCL